MHQLKKKLKLGSFIFCCVLFLTGCQNQVELEERSFVMALGIDLLASDFEVTYGFPDLKALTGTGENIHYPVKSITGPTLGKIEEKYHNQANKRIDYGQLQVIVLGERLLQNEERLKTLMWDLKNRQDFAGTILVCGALGKAKDILNLDEKVNGSIGIYLRDMLENNTEGQKVKEANLNQWILTLTARERPVEIVWLDALEETPEIKGMESLAP